MREMIPPLTNAGFIIDTAQQPRHVIGDARDAVLRARTQEGDIFLFRHGGQLMRLVYKGSELSLETANHASMAGILMRSATWTKPGKDGGTQNCEVPGYVSTDLLTFVDPRLNVLDAMVRMPVFAESGRLIAQPGYDPEARIYYAPPPGFEVPPIPMNPTDVQMHDAVDTLLDVFGDFPFASYIGQDTRTTLLCAIVLPFVRQMIHGPTPLHVFNAPEDRPGQGPGAGKTKLAHVISIITTGSAAKPSTLPASGEITFTLAAILDSLPSVVLFDNIPKKLDIKELAAVITAEDTIKMRVVKEGRARELPNRALWIVTGNGIEMSDELLRRSIKVDLHAEENGHNRADFKYPNLVAHVRDHRAELVSAVLTIIQGWIAAGAPAGVERLGSFESWSDIVGGIVEHFDKFVGLDTPFTIKASTKEALSVVGWESILDAWVAGASGMPLRVDDVARLIRNAVVERAGGQELQKLVVGDSRAARPRVAAALRQIAGQPIGSYVVVIERDKSSNSNIYHVTNRP